MNTILFILGITCGIIGLSVGIIGLALGELTTTVSDLDFEVNGTAMAGVQLEGNATVSNETTGFE